MKHTFLKSCLTLTTLINSLILFNIAHAQTCMVSPIGPGVETVVSGRFGKSREAFQHGSASANPHMHGGLDFSTGAAVKPLYATTDGVITVKHFSSTAGNMLFIRRPNKEVAVYYHLTSYADDIKVGAEVKAGQHIGYSGNTPGGMAIHLHFEYLVPNAGDVRARVFPSNPSGSAFDPHTLPAKRSQNAGAYRTDPSPYFCETFRINDGHPDHAAILGADTKAQYQILFGSIPEGGVDPNVQYDQVSAAAANQALLLGDGEGNSEFYYGAIPEPPLGGYDMYSSRDMILTEAHRRLGDADWQKSIIVASTRALWIDYNRLEGTKTYLSQQLNEQNQRIEALYAAYLSLKIRNSKISQEAKEAGYSVAMRN